MPTPAGPPTRCWRRIGTTWNWQPTTAAANGIGVSFSHEDLKEPLVRRADWALGEEPLAKQLQGFHGRAVQRRRGRPPHPNRTEKRLIFRHNAIPRNDLCTVSPFSHAEPGNEMNSWRRLASRQWPGVVKRVIPEMLFLFLLLLFLLLLIIFLVLVLLLLLLFLPPLCRPPRSACSAQALGRGSVQDGIPTQSVGTR